MQQPAAQRRLLIVDPCDDCHRLLPGLRNAGWDVDSCMLTAALDHPAMGLLRLQAAHLRHPDAVRT